MGIKRKYLHVCLVYKTISVSFLSYTVKKKMTDQTQTINAFKNVECLNRNGVKTNALLWGLI